MKTMAARLSGETIMMDLESRRAPTPANLIKECEVGSESETETEVGKVEIVNQKFTLRNRLQFFTWNWFTAVMAAAGVTEAIYTMPFRFPALDYIGDAFLIFSLVLFTLTAGAITTRFFFHKGSFTMSFLTPSESLFIPASILAIGLLIMNIAQNGASLSVNHFGSGYEIIFWVYATIAFISSAGIYLTLWSTQTFCTSKMTPIWIFPAYPLLILAPLAASVINAGLIDTSLSISTKVIAAAALEFQAIGFLVALVIYCAFISRLMSHGLPCAQSRPGMFISVGPAGFTATGLIQLGQLAPTIVGTTSMAELGDPKMVATVIQIMGYTAGLSLWGLTLWFFVLSVGGQWRFITSKTRFDISFFAYVFPNSALVTSTHAVGKAFGSHALQVLGCVLSILLVIAYLTIFGKTVLAVYEGKLLMPAKEVVEVEIEKV